MTNTPNFIIKEVEPSTADALELIAELNTSLRQITGSSGAGSFSGEGLLTSCVGYLEGEPVCCGALRQYEGKVAEIKRVYARKNTVGAAHRMVSFLEEAAKAMGYTAICLETRLGNEHACQFYRNCGYRMGEHYGKYVGREDAACFWKTLKDE